MRYRDAIKQGINNVNKNYQLFLIQTVVLLMAFLLFILIVAVPLIIVFTKAGLEFPENGFKGMIELVFKKGLSPYIFIVTTMLLSLFIYILIASVIFIYALAGTSGVLMHSISGRGDYSWRLFRDLGKRLFKRFLLLSIFGLLMLILLSFVAGFFSGLVKVATSPGGDFLMDLLRNFFNLLLILLSLGAIICLMAIFTYASGFMILKDEGVLSALKDSLRFIIRMPGALIFYSLLSLVAIIITISFGFLGALLKSPGLYQFIVSIAQIYINLSILSSAFVYLYNAKVPLKPEEPHLEG